MPRTSQVCPHPGGRARRSRRHSTLALGCRVDDRGRQPARSCLRSRVWPSTRRLCDVREGVPARRVEGVRYPSLVLSVTRLRRTIETSFGNPASLQSELRGSSSRVQSAGGSGSGSDCGGVAALAGVSAACSSGSGVAGDGGGWGVVLGSALEDPCTQRLIVSQNAISKSSHWWWAAAHFRDARWTSFDGAPDSPWLRRRGEVAGNADPGWSALPIVDTVVGLAISPRRARSSRSASARSVRDSRALRSTARSRTRPATPRC